MNASKHTISWKTYKCQTVIVSQSCDLSIELLWAVGSSQLARIRWLCFCLNPSLTLIMIPWCVTKVVNIKNQHCFWFSPPHYADSVRHTPVLRPTHCLTLFVYLDWLWCRTRQRDDHLQVGERTPGLRCSSEHPVLCKGAIPPQTGLHHLEGRPCHAAERVGLLSH